MTDPVKPVLTNKEIRLEQFKIVSQNTSDHVVITDAAGVIVYVNQATLRVTGYSRQELLGRNVRSLNLWGGIMNQAYRNNIWQTIEERKRPFQGEVANKRKDGSRYIERLQIYPLMRDGEILNFVGIAQDITREREVDRSKTEFITLASHQLRTPLTSISLAIDILLRKGGNGITAGQKKAFNEIYDDIHRMSELIGALLDVSKIQLGTFVATPKPTDIIELVNAVLDESREQMQAKKLRLVKSYDHATPKIRTDKNIVRIVLQNLVSNAIKYTSGQGRITVRLHDREKDLIIEVRDTGWGIPEAQQEKVFTQFFRAQNVIQKEAQGTGLGLYLSLLLLHGINGRIWFKSKEGAGTTFFVSLPK